MATLYRLKITLQDAPVAISRTIEVPGTLSLNQFHLVLQAVMGWESSHLYQFEQGEQIWTHPAFLDPSYDIDSDFARDQDCEAVLCMLLQNVGDTMQYLYDFGDHWTHDIELIAIVHREFSLSQAVTLLEAKGACPPEDVGGVDGYAQLLAAFANEDAEELADYQLWLGCEQWDAGNAKPDVLAKRVQEVNNLLLQPEFDVEAYDDYIDDAFVSRFKFIGELFGLISVKPLPDDELYLLRDRFSITLNPEAAAMLRFSYPVV